MIDLFRTLSLRYLFKHWVRAGLIIASIALGVAAWVATEVLYATVTKSLRQAASPLRGTADFYVTNLATQFINVSLADSLHGQKEIGIDHIEPIIIENVRVSTGVSKGNEAILLGLRIPEPGEKHDPLAERKIEVVDLDLDAVKRSLFAEKGRAVLDRVRGSSHLAAGVVDLMVPPVVQQIGRRMFPSGIFRTPVLVGEQLDADVLKGQKYFMIQAGQRQMPVEVVGKLRAKGPAATLGGQAVLMAWPSAARLLNKPNQVHRLDVHLRPEVDRYEARKRIKEVLKDKAKVQTAEDQDKRLRHVLKGLETGFRLCGAGAIVVGLFLVFNALSVSVAERRHDIGILRSVGATRKQVRLLFLAEAMVLGVIGSILGLPLGIALAMLLLGPMQRSFNEFFRIIDVHNLVINPDILIMAAIMGVLTAQLAALVPASKAAAEEPADAVRRAPPGAGLGYRLLQIGGSVTLILIGVVLIAVKSDLTEALVVRMSAILVAAGVVLSILGYYLSPRVGSESSSATSRNSLASGIYGVLFIVLGLAGLAMRGSLAAEKGTYAALILILLGSMLLIPILSSFVTRMLQRMTRRWFPIEARLAVDNLVRSPGRTGLVVAALAAGVAMTVQTAGMIKSNEDAFREWIDATVKADVIIFSGGPATANAQPRSLSPRLAEEVLKTWPEAIRKKTRLVGQAFRYPEWSSDNRRATPSLDDEIADDGTLIFMTLIDAEGHYQANRERGESEESLRVWKRLAEEPGTVVISENFALIHHVEVGDTIQLPGKHGTVSWRVVGTVLDYNWIRGSIWVDLARNAEHFGAADVNAWDVYFPPEESKNAGKYRDMLQKSPLGARHALIGRTRDEVRDSYLLLVYQIYGLAYTQEMLIGVVAILGVVTALLISVLSRRRELGLLRAVGATRPQVMATVLSEGILIGIVGTLLGIAIGLPLEWYAVRIILFDEAGYLFPMRVAWGETAIIAAIAVLSATLAGLAPAIQAVRLRIADAIAYE